MFIRGRTAAHTARRAGFFIAFVDAPGLKIDGLFMDIGHGASEREILREAYRLQLSKAGPVSADRVELCVDEHLRTMQLPIAASQ